MSEINVCIIFFITFFRRSVFLLLYFWSTYTYLTWSLLLIIYVTIYIYEILNLENFYINKLVLIMVTWYLKHCMYFHLHTVVLVFLIYPPFPVYLHIINSKNMTVTWTYYTELPSDIIQFIKFGILLIIFLFCSSMSILGCFFYFTLVFLKVNWKFFRFYLLFPLCLICNVYLSFIVLLYESGLVSLLV